MKTPKRVSALSAAVVFISLFSLLLLVRGANGRYLDVPYVPTPDRVVEAMLDAAKVGSGDYVVDLGSGDGRIVIAAAKRGAFGHGIDLNPERIVEAEANAKDAGVSDKVVFLEGDLFETDFSRATVVTMYLLSSVNRKLKPLLFEQLRPGTRIVSHAFDMEDWEPDEHIAIDGSNVYYWVIPANLQGKWEWSRNGENYVMDVRQEFQEIAVDLRADNRKLEVDDPVLVGERVSFVAVDREKRNRYLFSGRVDEDGIKGIMQERDDQTGIVWIRSSQKNGKVENWDAKKH